MQGRLLILLSVLAVSPAAQALFLSTSSTATLGGLAFRSGDIVDYDLLTKTAHLIWLAAFVDTENLDALPALPGGRFLISTTTDAQLVFGLTFRDSDLVLH